MTLKPAHREAIPEMPNRLGIEGIEFIEYATNRPQALGQVLENMGFRPVARHRSREVTLYRQGGMNLVVNATPMGMNEGDALPMDVARISPDTFVGEVVMKTEMTAFLQAAKNHGCRVQVGSDMLFEQIPAYLEFFGLPTTTAQELRSLAQLSY